MAIIKNSIPFNRVLKVPVIPMLWELTHSLTGHGTCQFTVVNFRDQTTPIVEVSVELIRKQLYASEGSSYGWNESLELEGTVLKVSGKDWGPPHNRFKAVYREHKPEHCGFKFVRRDTPISDV